MNTKLYIPVLIAATVFIYSCAKIGAPPGGAKDDQPPVPVKSKPANYSVNYNKNKVWIEFNEFVVLKNQYNEFTVSPPLDKKPTPLVRGKKIVIELPASKLDSLTYTLDFGQSLSDNNENNPLPNFQFVISKANHIDSFSVRGTLLDAFTQKPPKEQMMVLLHTNNTDTAFQKVRPAYLGRTNPKGEFTINHIAPNTYMVYALKDANNNLRYDLPTEIIGFYSDPIYLIPDSFKIEQPLYSETKEDSVLVITEPDSLQIPDSPYHVFHNDSIAGPDSMDLKMFGFSFNLVSFLEDEPYKQYLVDYSRTNPEYFQLIFNQEPDSAISMRLLKPDTVGEWCILNGVPLNDTLVYWLADSNLVSRDSIVVEIIHPLTDSAGFTSLVTDTLAFRFKPVKTSKGDKARTTPRERSQHDENTADTLPYKPPRMTVSTNLKKAGHDLNVPIVLTAEAPVQAFNPELIKLMLFEDTLKKPVKYTLTSDTTDKRIFTVSAKFEPSAVYQLELYEGCFTDLYKRTIDTTMHKFTTQRDDYYGKFKIGFSKVTTSVIIQLLDKDQKIVRTQTIQQDGTVTFDFLYPAKYILKIIYDENKNGKWDTGNLKERRQPEKTAFYPTELEVRSNWEVEYSWELE